MDLSRYSERFRDLLLQCPHRGFDTSMLTLILYKETKVTMVEWLLVGNFPDKSANEGYIFLHELADKPGSERMKNPKDKSLIVKEFTELMHTWVIL